MENQIKSILADLKAIKISPKKVEEKLSFSNGLLGKAANGKLKLSAEKFELLKRFHVEHSGLKTENPTIKKLTEEIPHVTTADKIVPPVVEYNRVQEPWAKAVFDYCSKAGITPENLISLHNEVSKRSKASDLFKKEEKPSTDAKYDLFAVKMGIKK